MKALVIDDEPTIRDIISTELENCGFTVHCCENGRKALLHIEKHNVPDLVVIDLFMPEKEGIETIRDIRRYSNSCQIIAISGGGSVSANQALDYAQKLGANAIFSKPIDLDQLSLTVIQLTTEKRKAAS